MKIVILLTLVSGVKKSGYVKKKFRNDRYLQNTHESLKKSFYPLYLNLTKLIVKSKKIYLNSNIVEVHQYVE